MLKDVRKLGQARPCFHIEASMRRVMSNGCLKTRGTPPNGHSKNDNDAKPWEFLGCKWVHYVQH